MPITGVGQIAESPRLTTAIQQENIALWRIQKGVVVNPRDACQQIDAMRFASLRPPLDDQGLLIR
jgi:hypothetical protein